MFGKLRRHKLVTSVRGPGGGYNLAKPPETVSVAYIIHAVDEPLDATQCRGKANCHEEQPCMTHNLWTNLNIHMFDYLNSVTLGDLVLEQRQALGTGAVAVVHDARPQRRVRRTAEAVAA